jgi:CHAT domain-containing protein
VLRLDRSTVQMPWELLHLEERFVSRAGIIARQLEGGVPGRTAPAVDDDDASLNVLVIGDPGGNLRAARAEAEAVVQALRRVRGVRVTSFIGKASYKDISVALDETRFDAVHYAGHGVYDSLRGTALVLGDDVLMTAEDLATRRYLPRLFFGNACYSATSGGDTELLVGTLPSLVTGLLSAGVRAFIGAQWPVDDRAAKTFATAFYRALLARDTVGAATRQAREAVVAAHGEGEPAWAAYALYGPPWLTMS